MPATAQLHVGCQTITWGEDQRHFLPRVFAASAQRGYEGVEIGFRHIQSTASSALKGLLAEHGLKLIATHLGGNLLDTSQATGERAILDEALAYLQTVGCARLMYSGLRFENKGQFDCDLQTLREAAATCRAYGVELLYHNHDWEFADDGRVIEALIEQTDLCFCPDVGWVIKGGADVVALLDRLGDRVGALHLKDFASATGGTVDTVMLGQGIAPLKEAAAWAAKHRPGLWLIAEQDRAAGTPEQAIGQNAAFVRQLTGGDQA